MLSRSPLSSLTSLLPSSATLLRLARISRFVLRAPRKIRPDQLLRSVLLALCESTPHFRAIAENISSFKEHDPSRQAVFERLKAETAPSFFYQVFREVLNSQCRRFTRSDAGLRAALGAGRDLFGRILIEDGSVLPLHRSLLESFRGSANQFGDTAALRLRWAFDFLTGQTLDAGLHHWRDNDMSTAHDLLDHLLPGDLVLRDMGYFCLECLERIAAMGACFLTRVPEGKVIADAETKRLDLPRLLRGAEGRGRSVVEWRVRIGEKRSVPGRLVAVRVDASKAAERRRKLKAKRKEQKKGRPTRDELTMCDWVVIFTNVETDQLEAESVAQLYRARWMVEIFFKGMKSGQNLESWSRHRTNENTIQCLAYAQMIIGVLSLNLWRVLGAILLADASQLRPADDTPGSEPIPAPPPTAGALKSFEMLSALLAKVFAGELRGRALHEELRRSARYAAQEKRQRKPLDVVILELLA